ncbi:hypothetical protein CVT26_003950 [Gymnopilus dilepis]|uniref:Uncharacterized protein n=1 Tax=Gymnopilus dilepis TaxID=231916 RepID=A0A409W251_9AGAR|nr:hypothetical protein CVT26_003950 [Gymnopilus dilepis]
MDTSRTPLSPGSNKRRRVSPSEDPPMGSQSQQQTSLPSIRQLHPYLPSMPQHLSPDPGYSYSPTPTHYPSHLGQVESGTSHGAGAGLSWGARAHSARDTSGDDVDQRGPPKKKRRRQALSCTGFNHVLPARAEEKRLGVNGQSSNQEKYATKAEFDELKARFEQLAALVQRLLPSAATSLPYYQMGVQPAMPGVAGEAVQSYSSGASSSLGYTSLMPPPPQPPQQQQAYPQHMETSSPATNRYMKLEGTQSPTRHAHSSSSGVPSTSSPVISSALLNAPLPRHRPESSPSSAAATVKASPLSLASITSPYHPERSQHGQSKNFHAQTLTLGERLRPESEDPTTTFDKTSAASTAPPPQGSAPPSSYQIQPGPSRGVSDPSMRSVTLPTARDDDRTRMSSFQSGGRDR